MLGKYTRIVNVCIFGVRMVSCVPELGKTWVEQIVRRVGSEKASEMCRHDKRRRLGFYAVYLMNREAHNWQFEQSHLGGCRYRLRFRFYKVWRMGSQSYDRMARPIWRARCNDLLARGKAFHLHLFPTQAVLFVGGCLNDRGCLAPLYSHVNPYGRFELDLESRMDFQSMVA